MDLLSDDKSSFYKEKFQKLTYIKRKIQNSEFENCIFEKCIFIECEFENCRFIDCTFCECSISANKPYNSQFTNINFKNSKIMGFDWTKTKTVRLLSFEQCDISYSNFSFIKLQGLKLIECIVHEANFNDADLSGGVFTKTDFLKSIFSNTNLTRADFRKACNYGIDINFNILKRAKFSLPRQRHFLKVLILYLKSREEE